MPSAFISHSSQDDAYASELEQLIRHLGYAEVFNDDRSIAPDELFAPRIEQAIRDCDVFVVVFSRHSVLSRQVAYEIELARLYARKLIPLRIDDCALPPGFDDRDVVELWRERLRKPKLAVSRIARHAPQHLFGRGDWLDKLDAAWTSRKVQVYALVAWGGAGKTALVATWAQRLLQAAQDAGVERYFDWSFYSQGAREHSQTSADLFIARALQFFGDAEPQAGTPWERGERLAGLISQYRTLLVLDGVEPLQYPPNSAQAGEFKDQALTSLLQGLALGQPGLCVVTSRQSLSMLDAFASADGRVREEPLHRLPRNDGRALLRHLGTTGSDEELDAAWCETGGHALTLQLLGRFLADAYRGDIRYRHEVRLADADRETPGRTAMKVLASYENWLSSAGPERQRDLAVLRLTGLFDRPAQPGCIAALRAAPAIVGLTDSLVGLADWQWRKALTDLETLGLLSLQDDDTGDASNAWTVDAHPLVREYFADQLSRHQPLAFRAAHSRLFDHLCTNSDWQPDTLAAMQPLFEAVAHGCLAGRHDEACNEVYRKRIVREDSPDGYYSQKMLGAVGADLAACSAFYDQPWHTLSAHLSRKDQAWLFAVTAFDLRALGRIHDALKPLRTGFQLELQAEDWCNAAVSASNLSELELAIGALDRAIDYGRQGVELADRCGDAYDRMAGRATAATALHQAGRWDEARALFGAAETMQAETEPQWPLLRSLWGFEYTDLLLAAAERCAWQAVLGSFVEASSRDQALRACDDALRRSRQTLAWFDARYALLPKALDHLTALRASLYRELIVHGPESARIADAAQLAQDSAQTLTRLRQANDAIYLPQALLSCALFAATLGRQPAQARKHLREAELIASRGPMPICLADIQLCRARLFQDADALAKAAQLIARHAYARRLSELADARAALQ